MIENTAESTDLDRVEALRALSILDTPPEERFDRITRLGSAVFRVPICLVSLADAGREWFKSCVGLPAREIPGPLSFCAHALRKDSLLVIEDAAKDSRFATNALVTGPPHIRFYAGQPIHAPNQVPVGCFCIIDTVARSICEEESRLLRDLASMVENQLGNLELNRMAEALRLKESELSIARNEASNLAKVKSKFLSIMSHEIRTPIHAMLASAALMRETKLESAQRECVQTIETCGDALLSLINDILDFSKIEEGKLAIEGKPFDLRACVQNVASVFASRAKAKNIALTLSLDAELPHWIVSDEGRIRQILCNFLSNALKFTAVGGISIKATFTPEGAASGEVTLAVSDTGAGIAAETAKSLFQPTPANTPISRRFGGPGLGLSIIRGLAATMNGKAGVDSEPGHGSTFWFRFPTEIVQDGPPPTAPVAEHSSGREEWTRLRILLAEDNTINQKLALKMFHSLGVKPDIAKDGVEAVELATKNSYDAIFLDIQMPRMDGLEAAAVLQQKLSSVRPELVAVTSATMADDRARCAAAGFDRFLGKPFRLPELATILSAIANDLPAERCEPVVVAF